MKKIFLTILLFVLSFSLSYGQTIVGQWDFEDPTNFGKATIGDDLELFGNVTAVAGPVEGKAAILLENGDYLKATTNIIPQGEGVNTYTLRMDIKMDELGWSSLIQTDTSNSSDGDLFVTPSGTMGAGGIGYSTVIFSDSTWYRMILVSEVINDSTVTRDIYLNGTLAYAGNDDDLMNRLTLDEQVLLFCDNGDEEMPTDVAQIVLYNYALSADEVAELGGPTNVVKKDMIVGQWDFNDPNYLEKATVGTDLLMFGNAIAVPGPRAEDGDGAILLENGDYLKAVTNLTPRDSNSYANTYTYRIDIKMDTLGWNSLLQSDLTNNLDGRLFVNGAGSVGKGSIGYSNPVVNAGQWHRLIMTVEEDTGSNDVGVNIYLDGSQILVGTRQSVDSYYALRDSVFFFLDNDGEEMPTNVGQVVLYNYALSDEEIAELGTPLNKEEIQDPLPKGTELIANYGFNDGLNGWIFNNADSLTGATWELDQSSVINGPNSVKVHMDTCAGGSPSGRVALYTQVPVEEGKEYYITFKMKATKQINMWDLYWVFYESVEDGNYYSPSSWDLASWTMEKDSIYKFELNYTPDFTNPDAYFSIDFGYMATGPVDFWLDDIHLIKLAEPEPSGSKSLSFNGGAERNQYVVTYDSTNHFSLGEDFTMEAWVKFDNFDAPGGEDHIMRLGAQLFVDGDNHLKVKTDSYVAGTTELVTDKWYHIAYVRTAAQLTVYLDGVEEIVAAGADAGSSERFLLGSYGVPNISYNFAGKLDEVRLWSSARTEEEINATKEVELEGTEDSLVIYYNFNDGEGNIVVDVAGEDNNGELFNMADSNWSNDNPFERPLPPDELPLPEGKELLTNNYFNDGLTNWDLNLTVQSAATLALDNSGVLEGDNSAKVHVKATYSDGSWKNQFRQTEMKGTLIEGNSYHVQFRIKANKAISNIYAVVQQNHGSFSDVYSKEIALDADSMVTVVDTFVCAETDSMVTFAFNLGTASVKDVDIWFDAIHLIDVGEVVSVEEEEALPTVFALRQNYPNPFNPTTVISFALPKAADVNLTVYNILGQKVTELVNTKMVAGNHSINFNAANLASGVYIYRIQAGSFVSVKKMMLLK